MSRTSESPARPAADAEEAAALELAPPVPARAAGSPGTPPEGGDGAERGGLTEEERLLQSIARDFADREVAPGAIERDEAEHFDRSLFGRMGELGFTGGPFPEREGGAGLSYLGWVLLMEELGRADLAAAVTLSVHILSQAPVVRWGTDEQRRRWLPAMMGGEALGAFALTEPGAGSDAAALRLRATPLTADGSALAVGPGLRPGEPGSAGSGAAAYRLDGTKIWISNAPDAERYVVFATLDPGLGRDGITAFLVERGTPGFRFGVKERKMGIRACPASELIFDGAVVPEANRLGPEGGGYRIALASLGEGRISIAAACTGLAQAALERAASHVQERQAFGGPLSDQEGVRFMLAEMAREVAAARALTREAARARDRGEPIAEASSLAKWTASDAAMRVATDAVQLLGASGYARDAGVERLMRDAKGAQIYEGTNQIHRLIVADAVLRATRPA